MKGVKGSAQLFLSPPTRGSFREPFTTLHLSTNFPFGRDVVTAVEVLAVELHELADLVAQLIFEAA